MEQSLVENRGELSQIYIDMLGGDPNPNTKEVDALSKNLRAFEEFFKREYARLVRHKISLVLFGRGETISAVVDKIHQNTIAPNGERPVVNVVDCEAQVPMAAKRLVKDSSMEVMFSQAKRENPNMIYTAGSTAAEVMGAAKFRERNLGAPFIEKELLPGVWFSDNGALPKLKLEQYAMMDRVLSSNLEPECIEDRRAMVLPSDDFSETEIQAYLQEQRAVNNFLDFDPLAEIGFAETSQRPDIVLADGFIGNLHLKFMELLYRERLGLWYLAKTQERQALRDQVQPLVKVETEKGFKWEIPAALASVPQVGVLCNGGEETKGTPELKGMMKTLDKSQFFYIEPKDLLAKPELPVVATPASKVLVDAFFDKSFLKTILRHPLRAQKVKAARKNVPAMAEITNLKEGAPRVMAAHGRAEITDTVQNLSALVEMVIQEAKI